MRNKGDMDLEIGSDDDLFQGAKDVSKEQQAWSPKRCETECVLNLSPTVQDDRSNPASTEHAQIFCHRGDYLYSKKRFSSALAAYTGGLAMVAVRYVVLRRLLLEGAARCCVHVQDYVQAFSMAAKLMEESLTLDHRITSHSLLATVHAAAGNQLEAIQSLQICIQLHRSNVHFWLRLAKAYSALYCQSGYASRSGLSREETAPPSCCCRCLGHTTRQADCNSRTDVVVSRNKACHGAVSHPTPRDEQPPRGATYAGSVVEGSRNAAPPESDDRACAAIGRLNLDATPALESKPDLSGDGPVCSVGNPAPDGSGTAAASPSRPHPAAEHCDVSAADLLNEFDSRAVAGDDGTGKDCEELTRAQLTCRDCQPLHFAASCLLRARLLLKSVSHSVRSFAKDQNGRWLCQVEEMLQDFDLGSDLLRVLQRHARQIIRRGHHQRAEVVAGETEEGGATDNVENGDDKLGGGESGLSVAEFEQDWFPWILSQLKGSEKNLDVDLPKT